jgi:hypothetical protein
MNKVVGQEYSQYRRIGRAVGFMGAMACGAVTFGLARYFTPETGGFLINSGPHVAAGIVFGSAANASIEKTNGRDRHSLRHAMVGAAIVGSLCLGGNHLFELFGHRIDKILDGGLNPALSLRREGVAYNDWLADDIGATIGAAAGYLVTAAAFGFNRLSSGLKSRFSNLIPSRYQQLRRPSQP